MTTAYVAIRDDDTSLSADEVVYLIAWGARPLVEWAREFCRRQIPVGDAVALAAQANRLRLAVEQIGPHEVVTLDRLLDLLDAGVDEGQALEYIGVDIVDVDTMERLARGGVSGADAFGYWDGIGAEPDEMLRLAAAGVSPANAKRYGTDVVDDVCRLAAAGVSGDTAAHYLVAGIDDPDTAIWLHHGGVSGPAALMYAHAGVEVDDMPALAERSVTPTDAARWKSAGAAFWEVPHLIDEGHDPDTYRA